MPKVQTRQIQAEPSLRRHLGHPGRDSQVCQLRIASAIADYLADVHARRSAQAGDRLKQLLTDFRRSCHRRHLRAINRRDLIAYMTALRSRGLADRTTLTACRRCRRFLGRSVSKGCCRVGIYPDTRRNLSMPTTKQKSPNSFELATRNRRRILDSSSAPAVANGKLRI